MILICSYLFYRKAILAVKRKELNENKNRQHQTSDPGIALLPAHTPATGLSTGWLPSLLHPLVLTGTELAVSDIRDD